MNQAIQFPDREVWDVLTGRVCFPVLISGMLAECLVSESLLYRRYGRGEAALIIFQQNRWDIEEEFEVLIEQDLECECYMLLEDK